MASVQRLVHTGMHTAGANGPTHSSVRCHRRMKLFGAAHEHGVSHVTLPLVWTVLNFTEHPAHASTLLAPALQEPGTNTLST